MSVEIPIRSLYEHVEMLAKRQPRAVALVDCDENGKALEEITYGALPDRLRAAASYLHSLGFKKNDKIALAFRNSSDLLILSWAAWANGLVTVPLDVKRDTEELSAYKIKLNEAKGLIIQHGAFPTPTLDVPVIDFTGVPELQKKVAWEDGLDHLALILFTSGTTAHPKGAKLTLKNLIINADGIRDWLRITNEDRFLVQLPLHHINSTTFCLSALLAGGTIAIPPRYSNSRFWQQVAESGATITSIVQSILADQLERTDEYARVTDRIKLSRIQIGSAPVVAHTVQEFIKRFAIRVYQGYGQTETALRVCGVPMHISDVLYEQLVEENCIGVPMGWADLQIAGKDGKILGEGEEGELLVKGAAVMEGYIGGEPARTTDGVQSGGEAFRDGYFLTGDIGYFKVIDGKKFFYLKGRSREIIIKGGINISPVAVENAIKKVSQDVSQVYCVGFPDDRYGEEVAVAIVWREGINQEEAMMRLKYTLICGTEILSAYETPRYLATITAEELPLTSTGKVQRTILRKNLPADRFSSIYNLLQTPRYRFSILAPHSKLVAESHALYNHSWQPLTLSLKEYSKDIDKQTIIIAEDGSGRLAGQIAVVRTNLSAEQLLGTKYMELLSPRVSNPHGKALVCISICSADFKPKPVPAVDSIPKKEIVETYLKTVGDPVMRFHEKPKGGLPEGARLVGLIPEGRPEDTSACGYNMLVKYPELDTPVKISEDATVSSQLIEVTMLLAQSIGCKDIYAYSRPGGLAAYIAKLEN